MNGLALNMRFQLVGIIALNVLYFLTVQAEMSSLIYVFFATGAALYYHPFMIIRIIKSNAENKVVEIGVAVCISMCLLMPYIAYAVGLTLGIKIALLLLMVILWAILLFRHHLTGSRAYVIIGCQSLVALAYFMNF